MTDELFLGVDCGQTHLEAVVMDSSGHVLARGQGGPSHVQGAVMKDVFEEALAGALAFVDSALLAAVTGIGVGVTGLGIPGKQEAIQVVLGQRFPGVSVRMEDDAMASHWGATLGEDGVTVLAGTGTVAYGSYRGRRCKLGGFGYLFGDEGGGSWIGLTALRRALQAAEGRAPQTSLVERIAQYFRVDDVRKVPGICYAEGRVDVQRIARLAQVVCQAAEAGDGTACSILEEAAHHLAALARHALCRLEVPATVPFSLYGMGGIWRAGDLLTQPCERAVRSEYPLAEWRPPKADPAVGAALLALERLHPERFQRSAELPGA
ncbi:MAG: hypothetical protein K6T30_01010 [Alicyclobacillus sp.]|nr:hypothetical protein [Alicyclobacillus sp.]